MKSKSGLSAFCSFSLSEPNAPRNLRQTAVTTDTISLGWDPPVATSGSFEGYIIIINAVGASPDSEVSIIF